MKQKCIFIGTSWNAGAVSAHFRGLADELVGRGHRVILLVDKRRTDIENHHANPAIYTWPSARSTGRRDALFLRALIQKHRPEMLIANFGSVNLCMMLGRLFNIPHRIAWYHTLTAQIAADSPLTPWRQALSRKRTSLFWRLATKVIANSNAAALDVAQHYGIESAKITVFFNSIADPQPLVTTDRRTQPPDLSFISVGRFHESKGQDIAIKSLAMLSNSHPGAKIKFVGDGPTRKACEDLARNLGVQNRVAFHGELHYSETLNLVSSSYAMITTSRSEAFGLVNIEAMSMGVPVIATRVGGIPEIIHDGLDGFLVPPDDPAALAARIAMLLDNPGRREEMGQNARNHFLKDFELNNQLNQQANWIESQLDG